MLITCTAVAAMPYMSEYHEDKARFEALTWVGPKTDVDRVERFFSVTYI